MTKHADVRTTPRPRTVVAAAALQLLTVVPFVVGVVVVARYGAKAQAAAEAETERQGVPATVLREQGVDFAGSESLALVLVLALVVLAALNLAGKRTGQILSWIFHPLLVALGLLIIPAQLFTVRFVEPLFKSANDPRLAQVDVRALVDAATAVMPGWLPGMTVAKLVLTTLGSLAVIVLLALAPSRRYFAG